MTSPAVIFDHVSKKYRLTHFKQGSLKDQLTTRLARLNPFSTQSQRHTEEDFWALKDVTFEIQRGECVGIIGPNGSGKSTTLKILSNVTQPTSGTSRINGRLGALIEVGAGFHAELSGRENIFLNGSILGMSKAEIRAKFDSIVDFSEIEQFIDTPVKHYSSGMYVRLGFAIAIHNEPEVMLIDEILAVGDLSFQRKCFAKIEELKREGRTIVLVSHSMSQIQSICERAILLNKGALVADGHADGVAHRYVALSSSGAVDAQAVRRGSGRTFELCDARMIDVDGEEIRSISPGAPTSIEIDYRADLPLNNPTLVLVLRRDRTRIYSSNTSVIGISLGTLLGAGSIRCDIGELPIMPHTLDLEVYLFDESQSILLDRLDKREFVIITKPSNLSLLGARCSDDPEDRGIIYKRASWFLTCREKDSATRTIAPCA